MQVRLSEWKVAVEGRGEHEKDGVLSMLSRSWPYRRGQHCQRERTRTSYMLTMCRREKRRKTKKKLRAVSAYCPIAMTQSFWPRPYLEGIEAQKQNLVESAL